MGMNSAARGGVLSRGCNPTPGLTHHQQGHSDRVHPGGFLHFALICCTVGCCRPGDRERSVAHRGVGGREAEAFSSGEASVDVRGAAAVGHQLMETNRNQALNYSFN